MQHILHVKGEKEEHRHESRHGDHLGCVSGGKPLDAKDGERKQRIGPPLLIEHEQDQEGDRCGELGDGAGCTPADIWGRDNRVHEEEHPASGEDGSSKIEVGERCLAPFTRNQPEGRAKDQEAYRRIYEKHPAPAGTLRQNPTEQYPDSGRKSSDASPGTKRLVTVTVLIECCRQNRKCSWKHQGGTRTLDKSSAYEDARTSSH